MKKTCTKCCTEKEVNSENFHKEKLSADGYRAECRMCRNKTRRSRREWEIYKNPEYDRIKDLRRYKTTPEWYENKLQEQGGHCALCSTTKDGNRRLNVDHNHACCTRKRNTRGKTCGKCTRGILCNDCNKRLGYLEAVLKDALVFPMLGKDNSWTGRALRYLLKYQ